LIKSKKEYLYYLEADRVAKSLPSKINLLQRAKNILFPDYIWEFQKTLRKLEYFINCKKGIPALLKRYFITRRFKKLSFKLGYTIPPNVFGPGLSIAHYGTIIVNGKAKIGANCRLHACVNIGTKAGYSGKAPTIGDNCYIGPGAKIFGDINIANGTAIGANSVVTKSFFEQNIAIAGVPGKKISEVDTLDFLIPATQIIKKGLHVKGDLSGIPAIELKKILKDDGVLDK